MKRLWGAVFVMGLSACVSRGDYDAKNQEVESAKRDLEAAKHQATQLQQQLATEEQQATELKNSLGIAQAQAITDEQKSALEEGKKAIQEAQERGKLLDDLQTKFKKMIDAGHLKVTTRHGRAVLHVHNDVLFDAGEAEVKPAGKAVLAEVAGALRGVGSRRFQVTGHTDNAPVTAATRKKYATNWELSTARAVAVVKILVADGVDPGVLSAAGYGQYDPIASNGTADGQAKNRRTEIVLMPHIPPLPAIVPDKK